MTRPNTPDRTNPDGSKTFTMKRACNGCGLLLGDVTKAEETRAILGLSMPDVRQECPSCGPTAPAAKCLPTTVVAGDVLCVENECDHEPEDRDAETNCGEVTEHTICATHAEFDRHGLVTHAEPWPCRHSKAVA